MSMGRYRGHGTHYSSSMGSRARYRHQQDDGSGPYAEEPLVPALFYITVAGMAGSIIARKSSFAFRFLSSAALSLGAARRLTMFFTSFGPMTIGARPGLTAVGPMAHETKDVVHDLSDKSHELVDRTQKALMNTKDETVEVTSDLKDKTVDAAKDSENKTGGAAEDLKDKSKGVTKKVKTKSKELGQNLDAKNQVKDQSEVKKNIERPAKDVQQSARETEEQARDGFREKTSFDKGDAERDFERLKSKARQGWKAARGSHEMRGRFDEMREHGQDGTQDHRRDLQKWDREVDDQVNRSDREVDDQVNRSDRDFKKQTKEMQDGAEDRLRNARREFRHGSEDLQHRYARKFDHDVDEAGSRFGAAAGGVGGSWGFGRPSEDDGGRRGRFEEREEYAGRGGDNGGGGRSMIDVAKEGKSRRPWREYDEGRDDTRSSSSSTGLSSRKAGSSSKNQAMKVSFKETAGQSKRSFRVRQAARSKTSSHTAVIIVKNKYTTFGDVMTTRLLIPTTTGSAWITVKTAEPRLTVNEKGEWNTNAERN
ncbi:hypothetical protein BGZ65_001380 [Modicella reniformis]|uniref:MICOS complex subunit n=1 Tax=Modicella reniformis TaxID=1440133 RepID=A0A9P6LT26_9FUNG|nr:hypothetical protein BGZ65_001380 [Modicella reniformis]